jgi:hypothetical protein
MYDQKIVDTLIPGYQWAAIGDVRAEVSTGPGAQRAPNRHCFRQPTLH